MGTALYVFRAGAGPKPVDGRSRYLFVKGVVLYQLATGRAAVGHSFAGGAMQPTNMRQPPPP